MEASTAGQPPAQTQPPPPQLTEEAALAALTVVLLSGAPAQVVEAQVAALAGALGITAAAVTAILPLVLGTPADEYVPEQGRASAFIRRTGTPRRAAYLLSALKRFETGGTLEQERQYMVQHLAAERARIAAARRVDLAAVEHGPVLSWNSVRDSHTTSGCRSAHGKSFRVERPPLVEGQVGFPGALHGGSCRCTPGPPRSGAALLPTPVGATMPG